MGDTNNTSSGPYQPIMNMTDVLGVVYDPTQPKATAHQNMELAVIIISLGFAIFLVALRIFIKLQRQKTIKPADWWMIAAGVVMVFPMLVCQVGANRMGGGLHAWNVTNEQALDWWRFTWGFIAYYFITSLLKISVLVSFLQIMPRHFKKLRYLVYTLSTLIAILGITCALMLLFQCRPFLSNFDIKVLQQTCINTDYLRFFWTGLSITFDLIMCSIPFQLLYHLQIRYHERVILICVFVATFLGTIACAINIYGIVSSKEEEQITDLTYYATIVIVCYDFEILMYAIGSFLPTLSPFLIKSFDRVTQMGSKNGSSARKSWLPSSATRQQNAALSKLPSQTDDSSVYGHESNPKATVNIGGIYVSSDIRVDSESKEAEIDQNEKCRRMSIGLGNI